MEKKKPPFNYLEIIVLAILAIIVFVPVQKPLPTAPKKIATLSIRPLSGGINIVQAKSVFKLYLDPNFRKWGLDKPQLRTREITVQVYQGSESISYRQMFNSLSNDLDSLCLTQSQIVEFVKKYPQIFKKNRVFTFFLFKENDEYFVAAITVYFGRLTIRARRLKYGRNIRFSQNKQFVIPL